MIKIEHLETFGWRGALRGMRNPLNSWNKADTIYGDHGEVIKLGTNDKDLMLRLAKSGGSHRKYLRMIHVQMDVTAPLRWWKDYDTYKVATVANGCSTMHKIHEVEFTRDMFVTENLDDKGLEILDGVIIYLNYCRGKFLASNKKDMDWFRRMIDILPDSYLQKRTIDLNYETVISLIHDRQYHKQQEFRDFCSKLKKELPYINDIYDAIFKTEIQEPKEIDILQSGKVFGDFIDSNTVIGKIKKELDEKMNIEYIVYFSISGDTGIHCKTLYVFVNPNLPLDTCIERTLCCKFGYSRGDIRIINYMPVDQLRSC